MVYNKTINLVLNDQYQALLDKMLCNTTDRINNIDNTRLKLISPSSKSSSSSSSLVRSSKSQREISRILRKDLAWDHDEEVSIFSIYNNSDIVSNSTTNDVRKKWSDYFLNTTDLEHSMVFALDMANKSERLGIEFDGPFHYTTDVHTKKRYVNGRTKFKKRLMKKLGWKKVIHIDYQEWDWISCNNRRKGDKKIEFVKSELNKLRK